jgi:hypothetical protein
MPDHPTPCRFCGDPAVAVFALDRGCLCYPEDREQALCMQHVVRASPAGSMLLTADLTRDGLFTRWWQGGPGKAESE